MRSPRRRVAVVLASLAMLGLAVTGCSTSTPGQCDTSDGPNMLS